MTYLADTPAGAAGGRWQAMILVPAILFCCGCAFIGNDAGLALFAAIFETLRARDLDTVLDSRQSLDAFRNGAWASGFPIGAFLFWYWHRNDPRLADSARSTAIKRWIVSAVGAAGAAHIGYLLFDGWAVGIMLVVSFVSLVAGAALMTAYYGRGSSTGGRIGHSVLTFGLGVALVLAWLAVSHKFSGVYHVLGEQHSVWFEIEFPSEAAPGAVPVLDPKTIAVELRTPAGTTRGFASEWVENRTKPTLRANVDLNERTRDRVLAVILPDRPTLIFRMPFPSNPAPNFDYGWERTIDALEERGAQRPATASEGYRIRYMLTN